VDIGGALAEARSQAGLTVTQVSDRTRIRATIIRDIEHDDYESCGGDYYARGHIRAIARVVGTDPVPLIAEYDAVHLPPVMPDLHPDGVAADPADGPAAEPRGLTAAEAFRPVLPLRSPGAPLSRQTIILAIALVAAIGLLIYILVA